MAKNYNKKEVKNVLITCFSSLGDVAMTIPIVYPVCEANPHVSFVFATGQVPATMFVNRPANLLVLGVDMDRFKGLMVPMRLARNLQHRYGFDALADLNNNFHTKLMANQLKRKGVVVVTIDKSKPKLSRDTHASVVPYHERFKVVFKQLNLDLGKEFTSVYAHGEAPSSPIVLAKEDGDRWIAIAPFSKHQGKMYPMEQMQLVISEISRWERCHIFLLGSKDEREVFDSIMKRYSNVLSLPHIKHTLADELALLNRCDIMLTMDSANMHLASLVNLPVVSVWGATHPASGIMGWHQAMRDTVHLDLDCRPCSVDGKKKCRFGDYHCMRDISPELIINKVKKVLER